MPPTKFVMLGFAAILTLGTVAVLADDLPAIVVDPAIASMTVDQKVEARQAEMKADGGLLRGARDLTGEEAVKTATAVLQNFTNFPALFADGATNDKSKALPIIWTEFDKFTAIFDEGKLVATKMREAAASGDAGLYADSLQAMGQVCSECHETYRGR
ncbi:MAG: cytochrome c [Devosia sp.]